MPSSLSHAAVITGDIVRSSRLERRQLDGLFARIREATDAMARWEDGAVLAGVNRFRGDGWQIVLGRPRLALRACLSIRALLRTQGRDCDTRAAVGIGAISHLEPDNLARSDGAAFLQSGRLLEAMKPAQRMDVSAPQLGEEVEQLAAATFALCDDISRRWTGKQAEVMWHALAPAAPTQEVIGQALNPAIKQQTVADHIHAAGGPALDTALAAFERLVDACDTPNRP